jgi:ATP-dependent Clp protease ATP-binding subunit ClpC
MEDQVMSEVKKTFAPEFINRLDEIIIFDELSDADLMEIIDLQIGKLNEMLTSRALQIRLTDDAKQWLIRKTCADRSYGARPLRRALQRNVEDELSESLIQGELSEESLVEVFCENDKLAFRSIRLEEMENALFESV